VVKKFEDTFIRFDRILEHDEQTDRRADGQTDTAWRYRLCLCIASRGKNVVQDWSSMCEIGRSTGTFAHSSWRTCNYALLLAFLSINRHIFLLRRSEQSSQLSNATSTPPGATQLHQQSFSLHQLQHPNAPWSKPLSRTDPSVTRMETAGSSLSAESRLGGHPSI